MHVGLFDSQDNLPGDSDAIEEVVDETNVVDQRVHVTGAQHEQRGQALGDEEGTDGQRQQVVIVCGSVVIYQEVEVCNGAGVVLTVKSRAGMGVQRLT